MSNKQSTTTNENPIDDALADQLAESHGIRMLYDDGTVETTDGRLVSFYRVHGVNMSREPQSKRDERAERLSRAFRRHVHPSNKNTDAEDEPPVSWYSATFGPSPTDREAGEQYLSAAYSDEYSGRQFAPARQYLEAVGEWTKDIEPDRWDSGGWRSYVAVQATDRDVHADDRSSDQGALWSPLDTIMRADKAAVENIAKRRQIKYDAVQSRLDDVSSAIGQADLRGEKASPFEVAQIILRFWSGDDRHDALSHDPNAADDQESGVPDRSDSPPQLSLLNRLTGKDLAELNGVTIDETGTARFVRPADDSPEGDTRPRPEHESGPRTPAPDRQATPERNTTAGGADWNERRNRSGREIAREVTPGIMDVQREAIRLDSQYTRTYWVSRWPLESQSMFANKLFTKPGVDMDIHLRFHPVDKSEAVTALRDVVPDVQVEAIEEGEQSTLSAEDVSTEARVWTKMYKMLQTSPSQCFRLSGYVTVRSDTESAYSLIRNSSREWQSLDAAALDALEHDCMDVVGDFESLQCELEAPQDEAAHRQLLRSCAPTGTDEWANATDYRTIVEELQHTSWLAANPRLTPVLEGMVGAIYPPYSGTFDQPAGVELGRNRQNGSTIRWDPFAAGQTAHSITFGVSGSGKTTTSASNWFRWWALGQDPDYIDEHDLPGPRTLFLADTQKGLYNIANLSDGETIVVDGESGINPFAFEGVPERLWDAVRSGELNPLGTHKDGVLAYFCTLLRSQGDDPAKYYPVLQRGIDDTYRNAGFRPTRPATHRNENPQTADFFATLKDMAQQEGESGGVTSKETGRADTERGSDADQSPWDVDGVAEERASMAKHLLVRLESFAEGGRHHHLMNRDTSGIGDADTRLFYLDMKQLRSLGDLEQSAMLFLYLLRFSQGVTNAPGETIAVFDEAHDLFHSDRATRWIEKAAREWRRYTAGLALISQNPREFLQRANRGGDDSDSGSGSATTAAVENNRGTIVEQASMRRVFGVPDMTDTGIDLLKQFGMNDRQARAATNDLTLGNSGQGYSNCLVNFSNREGWWNVHVEYPFYELRALEYLPHDHGDHPEYIAQFLPEHGSNAADEYLYYATDDRPSTNTAGVATDGSGTASERSHSTDADSGEG